MLIGHLKGQSTRIVLTHNSEAPAALGSLGHSPKKAVMSLPLFFCCDQMFSCHHTESQGLLQPTRPQGLAAIQDRRPECCQLYDCRKLGLFSSVSPHPLPSTATPPPHSAQLALLIPRGPVSSPASRHPIPCSCQRFKVHLLFSLPPLRDGDTLVLSGLQFIINLTK